MKPPAVGWGQLICNILLFSVLLDTGYGCFSRWFCKHFPGLPSANLSWFAQIKKTCERYSNDWGSNDCFWRWSFSFSNVFFWIDSTPALNSLVTTNFLQSAWWPAPQCTGPLHYYTLLTPREGSGQQQNLLAGPGVSVLIGQGWNDTQQLLLPGLP